MHGVAYRRVDNSASPERGVNGSAHRWCMRGVNHSAYRQSAEELTFLYIANSAFQQRDKVNDSADRRCGELTTPHIGKTRSHRHPASGICGFHDCSHHWCTETHAEYFIENVADQPCGESSTPRFADVGSQQLRPSVIQRESQLVIWSKFSEHLKGSLCL
jgi:hypothetical protein